MLAALEVATSPAAPVDGDAVDGDEVDGEPAEPEGRAGAKADPFSSTGEDLFVGNPFAEAQPAPPEPVEGELATAPFEDDPDPVVVAGRLRVAEARRTLAARQAAQRNALNRSELIEALEVAHAEVVEAHHRDRFGRSRSKVDEARATEQHLLEQLGFPSYTAFVLSAGAIRSGDEPAELAEAHAALAAAEAELARIVAERAEMQAAEEAAPGDEEGRWEEPPDTSAELRVALAEVGLVLEDVTTDAPTLVALAHSWLGEQEAALERRDALLAERADLVEQLAALPDPNEVEEALSEVAALARAEAELLGAEAEVSGITTRLEEIAEANKALMAEEAEDRQEPEDVEEQAAMSVEQRVDDVTWYLSTRLAALRAGGDQLILPILLDDPFVDFERDHAISLLASVEPFGGAVQIVLVTDDPALLEWTEALGRDRAWVVGAGL